MKALIKYFEKREQAIIVLLEKPGQAYTSVTFHKLRVEIKKLNALFDLINYCSKDFKRKKTFKPFRQIFHQAGKVRELQVEEAMLKKYFLGNLLKDYRGGLKKQQLKEKEYFFDLVNRKFVEMLKRLNWETHPFLDTINKKQLKSYIEKEKKKTGKLLRQKHLKAAQLHELRKQLKKLNYTRKYADKEKQNKSLPKKDILPELLGKWHDCRVIIRHLDKTMISGGINSKEKKLLEKIKTKISSDSAALFIRINRQILSL